MIVQTSCFSLDKGSVCIDKDELSRRLCVSRQFDTGCFDSCIEKAIQAAFPKCCYIRVPVTHKEKPTVFLGEIVIDSADLYKNLLGCSEAFVFAVTLGYSADRLLSRLSLLSGAEHFICDAALSALAESACDVSEQRIKGELCCKARFSPGYGDLELCVQKDILSYLNAERLLGITISDTLLMSPQKTITAIMGISGGK